MKGFKPRITTFTLGNEKTSYMATINGSIYNDNNTVNGSPRILHRQLVGSPAADSINGLAGNDIFGPRWQRHP
jgi:hypothetical protein